MRTILGDSKVKGSHKYLISCALTAEVKSPGGLFDMVGWGFGAQW